jgi:dipeptidyl aminopeptidase/acylaminoacyl peptidase
MADRRWFVILAWALMLIGMNDAHAQYNGVESVCPGTAIQARPTTFQPGGVILTTFDRTALWVYEIDTGRRYPLPDTAPCNRNCRLSPDARWISYYNRDTQAFNRMRLNGTQRRLIIDSASDVEWWGDGTFFVWTPAHRAYAFDEGNSALESRRNYDVRAVSSVQPNGVWGLQVTPTGDGSTFTRALVDVTNRERVIALNGDTAYYNARAWSPDARTLAFVAPLPVADLDIPGSEIMLIRPDENPLVPTTLTQLRAAYGAVRVNGLAVGELRWSPDGLRLAFWVTPVTGDDAQDADSEATIHVVDIATGRTRSYCGFTTTQHTPNPPRLVWSPDSTHLAFGGDVVDDDIAALLLALNIETGHLTRLSDGLYPVFGAPDVIAWGLLPN